MEEGTLSQWLIDDGAPVETGDALYVLETDKVDNEITASSKGVLRRSGVEGETYPVGTQIGTIE